MNAFVLSGLLTGITSSVLAFLVYAKAPARLPNRLWAIFAMAVAIWGFGAYRIALTTDPRTALLWWRISHIGIIFIPVLFLHFMFVFLSIQRTRLLLITYACGILFLLANFFTDYFVKDVRLVFNAFYYDSPPGPLYLPFVIFFFSVILYGHYEMYRAYRHATGLKKDQLKYFFLATALGFSGGSTAFLPVFGFDVYPLLNFTVPLYPIVMSYAIVRYRLMDISVMLNKSLAYILVVGAIAIAAAFATLLGARGSLTTAPPLIGGVLVAACSALVFSSHPRSPVNRTFSLYCAAVALWLIGAFMIYSAPTPDEAVFWCKAVYMGIVFIPAAFFHFTMRILGHPDATRHIRIPYLISLVFLIMVPTPLLISGSYHYSWGYYGKAGLLHPLFLVYFFTTIFIGLGHLFRAYRINYHYGTNETTRLKYAFWTFFLGLSASADFLQSYGYEFYPTGSLSAGLWLALVAYAITRHQFVEVRIPGWEHYRSLYVQVLIMLIAYTAIVMTIWLFLDSWQFMLAGILVGLFIVFSGWLGNLPQTIERLLGQRLLRDRYDAYNTIVQFSKSLVTILDLHSLTKEIVHTLRATMGITTASLYVLDSEKHVFTLATAQRDSSRTPLPPTIAPHEALPTALHHAATPMIREELEDSILDHSSALITAMRALDANVCVPLINKERLVGFFNLGPRHGHAIFSINDLGLLTTLGQHAAIALDNALLYEDLKRSQALMRRTDRLRSLETIAGGFAHEVRNPLTSIKTFVQLVPDRRDDQEFVEQFSQVVAEDVNRIERLVQEILDYARYMEPQLTEQDLNEVVTSCLYFIEIKATSRGVRIARELATDLPYVTIDRQQIKQVLLNLFINALDAMADQGGHLTVKTHLLTKSSGSEWVQIEVCDTGAGISEDNLEHIFDPFYTTKHNSVEREGTGLGLTIVHQIVREHRGYIEVTSSLGSGTTFYVNLPATQDELLRETLPSPEDQTASH